MTTGKETSKSTMASIGEKLKAARERRSLAIDQVQKQTRIHSTVLVALEEGRCDDILTATYVKGFLKSYSHYLGLDSKEMLKEYMAAHPESTSDNISQERTAREAARPDIVSKFIYGSSFIILVLAFLFFFTFLGKKAITILKKPKAVKAKVVPTRKAPEPARLQEKKDVKPAPQAQAAKTYPFKLTITVKQPVLVEAKKDGVVLFKRTLSKGLVKQFSVSEKMELSIAKGEAVELAIDGKSLGSPGKGIMKNVEITSRGIKIN